MKELKYLIDNHSYLIYKIVNLVMPIRVRIDQEERGLDNSQHGELFSS